MAEGTDVPIAVIAKNSKEELRVGLSHWKGYDLVHLRVFADASNGGPERIPTKSGFGIQVAKLPALIEALQAALAEARSRGMGQ